MTRYIPCVLAIGILLFLAGLPLLTVVGLLILFNLVGLIEDHLTGGKLFKKIVKEIKREPIVIHDVVVERDGTEKFKWKQKSNSSNKRWSNGTKNTGAVTRR